MNLKNIRKRGYTNRVIQHSLMWVNGQPKHNYVDEECVVDFSCCNPNLFIENLTVRQKLHERLIERLRGRHRNK